MAHLPSRIRTFAHVIGALGVAIGVEYDRHGIWVFAVPAGLAAAIMFGSWVSEISFIIECSSYKFIHKMSFCNVGEVLLSIVLEVCSVPY